MMRIWVVEVGDKWWDGREVVGAYTSEAEADKCAAEE